MSWIRSYALALYLALLSFDVFPTIAPLIKGSTCRTLVQVCDIHKHTYASMCNVPIYILAYVCYNVIMLKRKDDYGGCCKRILS